MSLNLKKHYLKQVTSPEVFKQLKYFEAEINYTNLYFEDGTHKKSGYTLKYFENLLTNELQFFRIHKSFFVNINYVGKIDVENSTLVIMNEIVLPISRRKLQIIMKSKKHQYVRDKLFFKNE